MKSTPFSLAIVGIAILSMSRAVSADPPIVISEPAAGFAYTAPSGWHKEDWPGHAYPVSCTASDSGYIPNINVIVKSNPRSFADHAKDALAAIPKLLPDGKILSQAGFETDTHMKGFRLAADTSLQGHKMRLLCYLLPGKGQFEYLVMFAAIESAHDKYDTAVDGAMRTFHQL